MHVQKNINIIKLRFCFSYYLPQSTSSFEVVQTLFGPGSCMCLFSNKVNNSFAIIIRADTSGHVMMAASARGRPAPCSKTVFSRGIMSGLHHLV